jgi:hypothetical protein
MESCEAPVSSALPRRRGDVAASVWARARMDSAKSIQFSAVRMVISGRLASTHCLKPAFGKRLLPLGTMVLAWSKARPARKA